MASHPPHSRRRSPPTPLVETLAGWSAQCVSFSEPLMQQSCDHRKRCTQYHLLSINNCNFAGIVNPLKTVDFLIWRRMSKKTRATNDPFTSWPLTSFWLMLRAYLTGIWTALVIEGGSLWFVTIVDAIDLRASRQKWTEIVKQIMDNWGDPHKHYKFYKLTCHV